MPVTTRDGVSLHYEHERHGSEPVVLVGDLAWGRWQWRWQREILAGDWDVLAPDTRGTDRSDTGLPPVLPRLPRRLRTRLLTGRGAYTVGGLAADLEAVLEDARARDVHLVGVGLGGAVALRYALEHRRAASLTLIGATPGGEAATGLEDEAREQLLTTAGQTRRAVLRKRMRPLFSERFRNRNPHLLDRLIEWQLEQGAPDPALEAQLGAFTAFDVSDRLSSVRVPTLVIHGADDRLVPVEDGHLLAQAVSDSRLLEVEGAGHACHIERDDEVTSRLEDFLLEVTDGPIDRIDL